VKNCNLGFLLIFIFSFANAQKISEVFQLDTIISIERTYTNPILTAPYFSDKDNFYFVLENSNDAPQRYKILTVDLNTYKKDTLIFNAPDLSFFVESINIKDFIKLGKRFYFLFLNSIVIYEFQEKNNYRFFDIIPLTTKFNNIYANQNTLFLSKAYNSTKNDDYFKTSIQVLNLNEKAIVNHIEPIIKPIEFTHYFYNKYIDFSSKEIAVLQPGKYRIEMYDLKLKKNKIIERNSLNWLTFPDSLIQKFNVSIPDNQKKILLDSMNNYIDNYNRAEAINFINDSTLMVRYKPIVLDKKNYFKYIDIYKLKSDEWKLYKSDLIDKRFDSFDTFTNKSFPIICSEKPLSFSKNKMIFVNSFSGIYPIGKTKVELDKQEEEYLMEYSNKTGIYFFKINLE
jgi:hypothetical protein